MDTGKQTALIFFVGGRRTHDDDTAKFTMHRFCDSENKDCIWLNANILDTSDFDSGMKMVYD